FIFWRDACIRRTPRLNGEFQPYSVPSQQKRSNDMSNGLAEYNPQMESFEYDFEAENSESGVFNESEEMELAAELLEVRDEAELEQFLGDLIKKAGSAIGKAVKSPIGQAIGDVLKAAA